MFKIEISTFPTLVPLGLNLVDGIEGVYNLTLVKPLSCLSDAILHLIIFLLAEVFYVLGLTVI